MKRFVFFLVLGLSLAFVGAAFADAGPVLDAGVAVDAGASGTVPDVGDDPGGFVKDTYNAIQNQQWWLFASMLVIALTWAARKWGSKVVPWLKTDRGGTVLAFAVAFLGGLAHGVVAEGSPDWEMLTTALKVALGAVGGYTGLKKTFFPSDKPKKSSRVGPKVPTAIVIS